MAATEMSFDCRHEDPWEEHLVPHFDKVVNRLRPETFLDRLMAVRLVLRSEYSKMQNQFTTDEQKARFLLTEILPKKGPKSYKKFCTTLASIPGQEHIAKLLTCPEAIVTAERRGPRKTARKTKHQREVVASETSRRPSQASRSARPIRGKRKRKAPPPTSSDTDSDRPESKPEWKDFPKRATLFFKRKHKQFIKPRLSMLRALFLENFGVPNSSLKDFYDSRKELDEDSCVFEGEDVKLVSVVLHGVSVREVEKKHPEVLDVIAAWARIKRGQIELESVKGGCAVMILKMKFEDYMLLMCQLSEPRLKQQLFDSLRQTMPSLSGAQITIGGLPPISMGQLEARTAVVDAPVEEYGRSTEVTSEIEDCELPPTAEAKAVQVDAPVEEDGRSTDTTSKIGDREPLPTADVLDTVESSKHFLDLVEQLQLIEDNPHRLVYKSQEERNHKTLNALLEFVKVILKNSDTRKTDVAAIFDSLVDKHHFTIAPTVLKQAKEQWEKRAHAFEVQDQSSLSSDAKTFLNEEALVTDINVYRCSLLSQAVYLERQQDVVHFLKGHQDHQLEEVALTDPGVFPRYLIATSGHTVYAAFKQRATDYLQMWLPSLYAMEDDIDDVDVNISMNRYYNVRLFAEKNMYIEKTSYERLMSQVSNLPLRFFARQLISRNRVIFTGHSLGGNLAQLATYQLLEKHYLASEENVVCITFGQLYGWASSGNYEKITQITKDMPECFHSFLSKEDNVPRALEGFRLAMQSWNYGYRQFLPSAQAVKDLQSLYSMVLQSSEDTSNSSEIAIKQSILSKIESLSTELKQTLRPSQYLEFVASKSLHPTQIGVCHILDSKTGQDKRIVVPVQESEECGELFALMDVALEETFVPSTNAVLQHSMDSYVRIVAGLLMKSSTKFEPSAKVTPVRELDSVIPQLISTGFQMRGSDQVVVTVKGDNMWFVTELKIDGVEKPLRVEPTEADKRSVSMLLSSREEVKDKDRKHRMVTVQSHFSGCTKHYTKVTTKVFDLTPRQKQLAKFSQTEIMEMAFLQVLLERRAGHSSKPQKKEYSDRFLVISDFIKRALEIVPVESIFHGIEKPNGEIWLECLNSANELLEQDSPKVEMSEMLITGIMYAVEGLCLYFTEFRRRPYAPEYSRQGIFSDIEACHRRRYRRIDQIYDEEEIFYLTERQGLASKRSSTVQYRQARFEGKRKDLHQVRLRYLFDICRTLRPMVRRGPHKSTNDAIFHAAQRFLNTVLKRLDNLSVSPRTVSAAGALCGLDVREVYPDLSSQHRSTFETKYHFQAPIAMLHTYRQQLHELAEEQTESLDKEVQPSHAQASLSREVPSRTPRKETEKAFPAESDSEQTSTDSLDVASETRYTNQKMLDLVTSMRSQFKATSILLGAFMEARIRVPFKADTSDRADAMFAEATSTLGVGVWALFGLPKLELRQLLEHPKMDTLIISVAELLGKWLDGESKESADYAGKLQFMLYSMGDSVHVSSKNVHYWLERQLQAQCEELDITKDTPLDDLVKKWDDYFKKDALSLITQSYRPLVARWLKWSLAVHDLRQTLAKYVAVGVIGLVNSGKSRLVERLFGIKVATGTVERRRTTVPFVYSLEEDISGLEIIDFPGVDDQDPTIPDLAQFLLGLAQLVVFVVDYRKCHTESTQKWIQELTKREIPLLICLSYGDKLYAEHMTKAEDATAPDAEIAQPSYPDDYYVRQVVKTQIEDSFTKVNEKVKTLDPDDFMMISIALDNDSNLNTRKGREHLEKAGIGRPVNVGFKIADNLRRLLHTKPADSLEAFLNRRFGRAATVETTPEKAHEV